MCTIEWCGFSLPALPDLVKAVHAGNPVPCDRPCAEQGRGFESTDQNLVQFHGFLNGMIAILCTFPMGLFSTVFHPSHLQKLPKRWISAHVLYVVCFMRQDCHLPLHESIGLDPRKPRGLQIETTRDLDRRTIRARPVAWYYKEHKVYPDEILAPWHGIFMISRAELLCIDFLAMACELSR